MIYPILIYPDSRLREVCEPVQEITSELKQLAKAMAETMYVAKGLGLAAPQVGVMISLLVIDCVITQFTQFIQPKPIEMFNPAIIWASSKMSVHDEGCLSLPNRRVKVARPTEVLVRWVGLDGIAQEELFSGLWATCIQHEIDHLAGKLIIDYEP